MGIETIILVLGVIVAIAVVVVVRKTTKDCAFGQAGRETDVQLTEPKSGIQLSRPYPGRKATEHLNLKHIMKTHHLLAGAILLSTSLATAAFAQNAGTTQPPRSSTTATSMVPIDGPRAGDREFTVSGTGMSNQDMNNSSGGIGLSLGRYLNDSWLFSVRQTANYVNPENAGSSWVGSTRAAFDFHFPVNDRVRPFIGAHVGGIYGGGVSDTFTAGLEAGVKYYVQPRTFIYAMADYAWDFADSEDIEDTFDEGGYQWNIGIGFNF